MDLGGRRREALAFAGDSLIWKFFVFTSLNVCFVGNVFKHILKVAFE